MEQSHHFVIVISYTQAFPVIATQNIHFEKGCVYQTCDENFVFNLMSLTLLSIVIWLL